MAVEKDEEEEAKDAQDDKQRHLASERRMKRERGDALAALQEQSKHNRHPRPKLEVEHFVLIHMRDAATDSNNTLLPSPCPVQHPPHRHADDDDVSRMAPDERN
jgi:hypothetical protein